MSSAWWRGLSSLASKVQQMRASHVLQGSGPWSWGRPTTLVGHHRTSSDRTTPHRQRCLVQRAKSPLDDGRGRPLCDPVAALRTGARVLVPCLRCFRKHGRRNVARRVGRTVPPRVFVRPFGQRFFKAMGRLRTCAASGSTNNGWLGCDRDLVDSVQAALAMFRWSNIRLIPKRVAPHPSLVEKLSHYLHKRPLVGCLAIAVIIILLSTGRAITDEWACKHDNMAPALF